MGDLGEILLWWGRRTLINAIVGDWLRGDVDIVTPEQMKARATRGLKPLLDRDGLFARPTESEPPVRPDPRQVQWRNEEFIRILGLTLLAMGRKEYIDAVTGMMHLRNLLIELLIEETAALGRGGAPCA